MPNSPSASNAEDGRSNMAAPIRAVSNAKLTPLVKDLFTLWREYMFGLNGMKAAKLFTPAERNLKANKQRYYRRNVIWLLIAKLTNAGHSPESAINEIHKVYGFKTSVSKVSEAIARDRHLHQLTGGYHTNFGLSS